jgi:hypothetical protein
MSGSVNVVKEIFKIAFESGKAEGFESRQGEIDALKARIAKLEKTEDDLRDQAWGKD